MSAVALSARASSASHGAPGTIPGRQVVFVPPGTPIAITGSGFSTTAIRNVVLIASIAAKVTAASPTRIDAVVPAGAVNGALQVMVGRQMATGPAIDVGVQAPLPPIVLTPPDPANRRLDPTTNLVVDMNRLVVRFDPLDTSLSLGDDATFGKYSSQLTDARVMQFSLRYEW